MRIICIQGPIHITYLYPVAGIFRDTVKKVYHAFVSGT